MQTMKVSYDNIMKRIIMLFLFSILFCNTYSQKVYKELKDVFSVSEIYFYGYDFCHFSLIEGKRMGESEKVKNTYVYAWIDWYNKYIPEKSLKKWLGKESITYKFNQSIKKIKNIDHINLVNVIKTDIDTDSIPIYLKDYDFEESEGIGLIVFMEYFCKADNITSMHFVFFDIATKNILSSYNQISDKASGHGLIEYWGKGGEFNFRHYVDYYKELRKSTL